MAVTKIWPVKGRLDAVIRYAGNEEKTRLPDLTVLSAGKDDLSDVLQYAANDAKTARESQLFVSGVNCVPEIARQQMELTKQQFGKTGGTVAFHAYQSFRPGEVTPEQCHATRCFGRQIEFLVFFLVVKSHLHFLRFWDAALRSASLVMRVNSTAMVGLSTSSTTKESFAPS